MQVIRWKRAFKLSKCVRIAMRNSGLLWSAFSGMISAVILRSSVVNVSFFIERFDKGCISMLLAGKSSTYSCGDGLRRKNLKNGFEGSMVFFRPHFFCVR